MARPMTKEERIRAYRYEHNCANKSDMECSYGYCKALVEGEMAIEDAVEDRQMNEMTRAEAEQALQKLGVPRDMGGKYHILEVLEALKIFKFKPEPKVLSPEDRFVTVIDNLAPSTGGRAILNCLKQCGLTITAT